MRRGKGVVAASARGVDAVMRAFGVKEAERLFPSAGKATALQRRAVKAPDGSTLRWHDLSQVFCLRTDSLSPDSTRRLVAALDSLPEVEYAEPNYLAYITAPTAAATPAPRDATAAMPGDKRADSYTARTICPRPGTNPYFGLQKGLLYEGLPELWTKPVVSKRRPVIAILDTGVDTEHPDLKDNIWTNTAEAEGEADYDNDGNGFKGDVHGWDFINNSPVIRDYNMHGTHCAGIAAAADNNLGIVGANPQALIMPVTVMQSDGTGDYATIARGIDYAVANGATVLSMSLGGYANSRALRQALENAYHSCVLVAAAGNDGKAIYPQCGKPFDAPMFPAAYSFVLGVQASDALPPLGFSNYDCDGPNFSQVTTHNDPEGYNYELMAPGVKILSTVPNGKYAYLSGTSMATPLVAGAISALQMVKEYASQEELWGDLTHAGNVLEAYGIKDRPAELDFLGMQLRDRRDLKDGEIDDNAYATNDGEADAGETLSIWPMLRTTFGPARGVKLQLAMGDEYEDASLVDILTPTVDFGMDLTAYGKGVSLNPLQVKISPTCADARHIKLKVIATAQGTGQTFEQPFTITVSNMHKIGGLIDKDSTLTADKTWYVTDNVGIMKGATLTIEPGTRLEFAKGVGLTSFGRLIARGTPKKPIIFTHHADGEYWNGIFSHASEDSHSKEHRYDYLYCNADSTQFTLRRTDATPYRINISDWSVFYYNPDQGRSPSRVFRLEYYIDPDSRAEQLKRDSTLASDPAFITPVVLKLMSDYNAWNDTCRIKYAYNEATGTTMSFSNSIYFEPNVHWSDIWYDNPIDTLQYCKIAYIEVPYGEGSPLPCIYNCEIKNAWRLLNPLPGSWWGKVTGECSNILFSDLLDTDKGQGIQNFIYTNIIGNRYGSLLPRQLTNYSSLKSCNYINIISIERNNSKKIGNIYWLAYDSSTPSVDHAEAPSYLGTAREDLVRPHRRFQIETRRFSFGHHNSSLGERRAARGGSTRPNERNRQFE